MAVSFLPPPKEVLAIVEEEFPNISGRILNCSRHKGRLFLRATVPHTQQVRPNDHVQGGVAVTTFSREICVFPYVFRQMQKSGAIITGLPGVERIKRVESGSSSQTLTQLRQLIRDQLHLCTSSDTLSKIIGQLQSAATAQVDPALQMSAVISQIPRQHSSLLLSQILSEFHDDEDTSVYALMNAVAVVARDEDDPETKWDLESLAGGVPTLAPGGRAPARGKGGHLSREVVGVG